MLGNGLNVKSYISHLLSVCLFKVMDWFNANFYGSLNVFIRDC